MENKKSAEAGSNPNELSDEIQKISTTRRILPQILATAAENLIIVNLGQFFGLPSIVIPSLSGVSKDLNPDETVQVTAAETSWLSSFVHMAHPIGSLLSGPICDRIGRRTTIMLVSVPLIVTWIMLGCAQSFPMICSGFMILGFCYGLKESPSVTYVGEISETSIRGMLMTFSPIAYNLGMFSVLGLGSILSWRHVSFICALSPICCFVAVLNIPESPSWLLSKDRLKDAQKSLQWLRGWVTSHTVHKEFTELQNYSDTANACAACFKESIRCYHPKPTFWDKLKELKRKRILKPCILMFGIQFFNAFAGITVWQPYIIQILNAFGTPINPNLVTVICSVNSMAASIFLLSTIKRIGKRQLYLTSTVIASVGLCCLGIYGFVFFPSGWTSFKEQPNDHAVDSELIRQIVGNYSYLALAIFFIAHFATQVLGFGVMFLCEVFPFKLRSFLCGISTANQYLLSAISAKIYYNIEMWLSLRGAALFYSFISLFGFITMYLIMPETEQRSLEDIELHYSDNSKGITDIYIRKKSINVE